MSSFDSPQPGGSPAPGYPLPSAYPQAQWFAPPPPRRTGLGHAALALGILSLVLGPLTGLPAIICGILGQRRYDQGRAPHLGAARVGMILGIITTIVMTAFILAVVYKLF